MQIPHHLVEQVRAGKAILFLGAGASFDATAPDAPYRPPNGKQLATLLSNKFLGEDLGDRPLSLVSEYCIAETDLRTVQEYVATVFNRFAPCASQISIADFRWAALITTNYDQLIEKAYSSNKKRLQSPVPILRDSDRVDFLCRSPDAVPFLKLHGCVSMADQVAIPLILTPEQYITHRVGREKLFNRFTEYAGEYSVIYVGYQLEDSDIRNILLKLDEVSTSRPAQYVVTPNPSVRDQRIWANKRIAALAGTFSDFMEALNLEIPRALREFKSTSHSHPICTKFSTKAEPTADLLSYLTHDATYVHNSMPCDSASAQAFFRGASFGWGSILAAHDSKRSLTDTILSEAILVDESARPRLADFYLVKGYAGSGKSVVLKRVAFEAATTFEKVVLFLRSEARLHVAPIAELCNLLGERLYLFVDGVARRAVELEALIQAARARDLSVTIIASERNNEWNVDGVRLSLLLDGTHHLRSLSRDEIDLLVGKLEQFKCLGELEDKSADERRDAFLSYADRQLLVALYEITSGTDFPVIVFDEYRNIVGERAKRIYLFVCALNRMGVPVRAGLILRLTGVSFTDFKRDFFSPLESIVLTEEYRPGSDMAYRARHPWIAQIVFERALPKEIDRYDLFLLILKEIDIGYTPDRAAFRESIRAKNLRELFSDPLLVEEIFSAAYNASPRDGYVFQQHAIYEMKRDNANLKRAGELLASARELLPNDKSITHTMSELEIARSAVARNNLERKLHLEQARQHATQLAGANADTSHGHVTLVKLAIGKLRGLLDNPDVDELELTTATKQVEQTLGDAFQQFRDDEHLLAAEAEYHTLLNNQAKAKGALERAIAKNSASPFIAKALSRVHETERDYLRARSILATALKIIPADKPLNGALARLIDRHFPLDGREAETYWLRSFTENDTNYSSQFWYARRLYLNGKAEEAIERFNRLKLARVSYEAKVSIAGRIRESGKVKQFDGVVSRLESDCAWVTPYGQKRPLYLHYSQMDPISWQQLRVGDSLKFGIGFNYFGPAITMLGVVH